MPLIKPQNMRAISTLEHQPDNMSSKIQIMIALDIAGYNGNEISENVGLCPTRVSQIRTSPMYKEAREIKWKELQDKVVEKKASEIVSGDPVEQKIKSLALEAVQTYETLLREGSTDFVKKSTSDAILDRAGYKAKSEKQVVTVEVTDKMAERFERVLGNESPKNARTSKVKFTQEVS